MKFLKTGLSLVVIGASFLVPGSTSAAQDSSQARPAAKGDGSTSLIARLRSTADGAVQISRDSATNDVSSLSVARGDDLLPDVTGTGGSAAAKADAFLATFAPAFGARSQELVRQDVRRTPAGTTVQYQQRFHGVPVFGSRLLAHVASDGALTSVNGYTAPDLSLSVTPSVSAQSAKDRALAIVRATPARQLGDKHPYQGLQAVSAQLNVYRLGVTRGVNGPSMLVWAVEVTNHHAVRQMLFVNAMTGKVVNRYSMIDNALDRELYEASIDDHGTPDDPSDDTVKKDLVWSEGDPFPAALTQDQQNEVLSTGESYWFYKNVFDRDSYDGKGSKMVTVNNDPNIQCPNANWNGVTTNYCSGVSSDDTVSHEWGHAYTEYTSGLVYQWQPGAMNEAYSDIWGETIDMLNDRFNETPDTHRTDDTCSQYTRGDISMNINSPVPAAGPCDAVAASFGPVFDKNGVTTDVVVATDPANDDGPSTTDGCSPFTNAAAVAGKFAFVDRGTCAFVDKVANAENAGATGIVVGQNRDQAPFSISANSSIYGVMVDQASGNRIKAAGTVNATIKDSDTAAKDNSYRWLSGESDAAFGGAIRDMWNPTCYGDPGKVSDTEYACDTADSGGVHTNSGVVNHTYALLVDGGTSNGVAVPGIGLDKAAQIFWRTQTEHLFPVADFTDLADGLEASCTELIGAPIRELTITPNATPTQATPITPADCLAVTAATRATELRKAPTQCNFGPLLKKDTPAICGPGYNTKVTYRENFEDGLAGWTKNGEAVYPGAHGLPWQAVSGAAVPAGHSTKVAFAPDPLSDGQCDGSPDDRSSHDSITSPSITVPAGTSPRLSFAHYVATELGADGGNVKISVGNGAFTVVPASAYMFNAPGAELLTADDGNTDPLAGELAFTGSDGGEAKGSWGMSRIDLSKVAKAGQKIRIRFDFGRDGCNGLDGWYVDDVTVAVCKTLTSTRSTPSLNRAHVRVARKGTTGSDPTGKVVLRRAGKFVASGTLKNGEVTLTVPDRFAAGRYRFGVFYLGGGDFRPSSDAVLIRVR